DTSSKLGLTKTTSVTPSPSAPKVDDKAKDPSSEIKDKFDKSSKDAQEQVNNLSSKLGLGGKTSAAPTVSGKPSVTESKDKLNDLSNKLGGKDKVAIFAGVIALIAAIGGAIAAFLPQIPGLKLPAIPGIPGR
ncbi:MAG: hypothetical protein ACFNWU_08030, partial [Corynebacterium matruchotii]